MPCSGGTATSVEARASVDVLITGWHSAGVVQSESSCHEGDGDRIHADVDPTSVGDAKVEVESKAEQETPSGHGALATTEAWVVESRPCVVDEQPLGPVGNGVAFVYDSAAEDDEADAASDEDGVSEHFEMEPVLCVAKGSIGGLKGQQTAPRDVVSWVGHAEHVQGGKDQTPNAEEDQGRSINGHFAVNGLAGFIVAHALADWRTAFKHTEQSNPLGSRVLHSEVWW